MGEKVTFEELNVILRRFEAMEKILQESEQLKSAGEEFLAKLMGDVRASIKTQMFYVLMDFMIAQGKLKPAPGGSKGDPQ